MNLENSHGIHLVGSVPMPNAETVFRSMAGELGPWLRRIPDGETGERRRWIYWQRDMLFRHPDMEIDTSVEPLELTQWDGTLIRKTEFVRFKSGADSSRVEFETGYADAALASYRCFANLRAEGVIPAGVRFQVCLPTPMASAYMYVSPNAMRDYLAAYERALLRDLETIQTAIPHEELCIQWDVCQEVLIFENYFPWRSAQYKTEVLDELARLGKHVPVDVEVGYHLCYGTPKGEHLVMPKDTAILVEIANGIVSRLTRPLEFLHLPVPRDRTDAAYFTPLDGLALSRDTELYLGLVHPDDTPSNDARVKAAQRVVPVFGIATECGWGRSEAARIPSLIAAHRHVMEPHTRAPREGLRPIDGC